MYVVSELMALCRLFTFRVTRFQLHIVPVTIDYEKPLEVMLHQNELLGEGKIKEVRASMSLFLII